MDSPFLSCENGVNITACFNCSYTILEHPTACQVGDVDHALMKMKAQVCTSTIHIPENAVLSKLYNAWYSRFMTYDGSCAVPFQQRRIIVVSCVSNLLMKKETCYAVNGALTCCRLWSLCCSWNLLGTRLFLSTCAQTILVKECFLPMVLIQLIAQDQFLEFMMIMTLAGTMETKGVHN